MYILLKLKHNIRICSNDLIDDTLISINADYFTRTIVSFEFKN